MTTLGRFFAKKSINRSDVSRKTGISKIRLSELANNITTQLKVKELYLISLAVDEDPGELFKEVLKTINYLKSDMVEATNLEAGSWSINY